MTAPIPPAASLESELFTDVSAIARRIGSRVLEGDDLDDMVQDIVLRCLIEYRKGRWSFDRARLPGLIKMMVFVFATHGSEARRRRDEREALHDRDMQDSAHVWMSPDLAIEQQGLEDVYQRTLDSLPAACRRAYTLVRDDELTYDQAAARLGVSRAAVHFHVVTAQNRFREALRDYGLEVPGPRRGGRVAGKAARGRTPRRTGVPELRLVNAGHESRSAAEPSRTTSSRTRSAAVEDGTIRGR